MERTGDNRESPPDGPQRTLMDPEEIGEQVWVAMMLAEDGGAEQEVGVLGSPGLSGAVIYPLCRVLACYSWESLVLVQKADRIRT